MDLRPGVNLTTVGKLAQDREAALSCGAAVFDLATARGSTRQAFFDAVRAALPLDPPLVRSQSWDTLSDSVWGGLDSLDTRTIVITWRDASTFKDVAPAEFEIASSTLHDVAERLASWEATDGEPKQVSVLLA
jgi:Barstar (barnase inhibitor)